MDERIEKMLEARELKFKEAYERGDPLPVLEELEYKVKVARRVALTYKMFPDEMERLS